MMTHVLDSCANEVKPPEIEGYHFIGNTNPMLIDDLFFSPYVDKYTWNIHNAAVADGNKIGKLYHIGKPSYYVLSSGLYRKTLFGYTILNDPNEIIKPQDYIFWASLYHSSAPFLASMLNKRGLDDSVNNAESNQSLISISARYGNEVHIYRRVNGFKRILGGNKHYQQPLPLP